MKGVYLISPRWKAHIYNICSAYYGTLCGKKTGPDWKDSARFKEDFSSLQEL